MTESADLDLIAKNVRAAADACSAMVLETVLAGESLTAVAVDGDTFPVLMKHLSPRLVYMVLTTFNAHEEVATFFEVDGDELDSGLKKLAAKWSVRNGQSSRIILGLMADGVMHGIVETADWFDDFEDDAGSLVAARQDAAVEAFERMREADAKKFDADEKKRLAPFIKKLIADPRFLAPKISIGKRVTLAETLFPDLDRSSVKKAVDRAVNELWLAGPG